MAEIPPGLTNAHVEEKHLTPIRLMFQGLANIRVNHTGVDNADDAADTIRNAGVGGALRILNRAGDADLFFVDDSGATVSTDDGGSPALTVQNLGTGGALAILDTNGDPLVTVEDGLTAVTGRMTVTADGAGMIALDVRNQDAAGVGLRVTNAAGDEARLLVAEAGTVVSGNDPAAHALSVTNLGAGGWAFVALHSGGTVHLIEAQDVGVTMEVPLLVRATDAVNHAGTFTNLGAGGLALRATDSTGLLDLLAVDDASARIGAVPVTIGAATPHVANTKNTFGLTIDQGAADDEVLSFKSSDVAHGVTAATETSTFGYVKKANASNGGLRIWGFGESGATMGLRLDGSAGTDNTAKSTAALGTISLYAWANSGTSIGAIGANGNLLTLANNNLTRFIVDAEGDIHADAGSGAASGTTGYYVYDEWADAELVRALDVHRKGRGLVETEFDAMLRYGRADLEAAGIATFNDGDGSVFVNYSALTRLLCGSTWQSHVRLLRLEARVQALGEASP